MIKYFLLFMIVVSACNSKKQSEDTQVCIPGFKPDAQEISVDTSQISTKEPSANELILANVDISSQPNAAPDPRTVILKLGKFTSKQYPNSAGVADSALHIASVLLSSKDFKDTLSKIDFTCQNYGRYCRNSCKRCNDRFAGSVVLDSVFREREVALDLFLDRCKNEFGHSTINIREIYSCQPVVFYDEPKMTPAYCYGYHIAHEYMHIVGFFHTDHVDDVAEKTGWIGWAILLKWKKAGIDVMKMQPGQL